MDRAFGPSPCTEALGAREASSADLARRALEARNHVLERIAMDAPLQEVLCILTSTCEVVSPGTFCSVLLLDPEARTLHHGAAPSLPDAYCQAIEGMSIGPAAGSCGAAAFTGERVIVEDVGTHPLWAGFREHALAAGLQACWSEPIRSSKGDVLGTFAVYYREPRAPSPEDIEFMITSAHIAAVAIERARAQEELRRYQQRLEELVEQRTAELVRVNQELRQALQDVKVLSGLLPICSWCKRVREDSGYWAQLEAYVSERSGAVFTHGICPECEAQLGAAGGDPR